METRSKNRSIQDEMPESEAVQDIEELYDQLTPFEPALYDKELIIQFIDYALQCYQENHFKDEILTEAF